MNFVERGRLFHFSLTVWKHKWFVLLVIVAVAFGGWQAGRLILGVAVVVDPVVRGDLVQTVVASGHIETPFRVEIGSQITGTVEDVLVEEGPARQQGSAARRNRGERTTRVSHTRGR